MLSTGTPGFGRTPRGSRRLRTVEGKAGQESEGAAEGEAEKNESDRKRKERTSGGLLGY